MNNKRTIILLIAIFFLSYGYAQEESLRKMKDTASFKIKLEGIAKSTTSIESDFTQEKHMSFMLEPIINKGHFYFKKENRIRWEYTDPFSYIIVMNNGKISIKDGDKEKKFDIKSRMIFNKINSMMLSTIKGDVLDNEDFKGTFLENDKYLIIQLVPTTSKMKKHMKQIHIYFDKVNYHVSKLRMEEVSGDYTIIKFQNRVTNENVSDDRFNL